MKPTCVSISNRITNESNSDKITKVETKVINVENKLTKEIEMVKLRISAIEKFNSSKQSITLPSVSLNKTQFVRRDNSNTT